MSKNLIILIMTLNIAAGSSHIENDTLSKSPFIVVACSLWTSERVLLKAFKEKNGELDGVFTDYYNSGKMKSQRTYSNGCAVDSGYMYFENGKIESKSFSIGCDKRGWELSFFVNGDTSIISTPEKSIFFYSKNCLKSITYYNAIGQKHGLCENWREDGTRRDSTVFENGKYVEERQYYTNGNIRHFNKYKNGVFWESYAWSPNGKPLEIIHNGTGKGTNYSEDGKTRYLREFKDGKEISCSIIPTED